MIEVIIKKNAKYGVLYNTPPNIRYILIYGGRAAGRSYQGSRALAINLLSKPYYRGFIMRNVLDTVRDSIFQDCVDRITELGLPISINDLILRYNENQIKGRGFKKSSGRDTAKNKSVAGINTVLIEEAEEIDKEDFNQMDLSLRTVKGQVVVVLLFNPPIKGHWILKEWFDLVPNPEYPEFFDMVPKKRDDTHYIFGTYKDNIKNLDPNNIKRMESFKTSDLDYYLHKILGLVPSGKTGRVFKNYNLIDDEEFDNLPYPSHFGLDFGFNDPTALVEVKLHDNKIWVKEQLYQSGLDIDTLHTYLANIKTKIIADSQAKQVIETLKMKGAWIESSIKGADSVVNGIRKLMSYEIYICRNSKHIQTEFENYTWKLDKNKEPTDVPDDSFNHAIDAIRYAIEPTYLDPSIQRKQALLKLYGNKNNT